jgi:hypothetical protein
LSSTAEKARSLQFEIIRAIRKVLTVMEFAVRTAGTVHFATVQCILYSLEISARLGNSGWLPRKTCTWVFPPSYAMCWVLYTDCTGCSPLRQKRLSAKENMHFSVPTLPCYALSSVHCT